MAQETTLEQLYEMVEQIESRIKMLKQALDTYARQNGKRKARTKRRVMKSLYGIFPRSDVTWEDFREARHSWARSLRNI